jgi:hypothetical protein
MPDSLEEAACTPVPLDPHCFNSQASLPHACRAPSSWRPTATSRSRKTPTRRSARTWARDEEALRCVKKLRFAPGEQRGKPVKVQFTLPVTFELPDEKR